MSEKMQSKWRSASIFPNIFLDKNFVRERHSKLLFLTQVYGIYWPTFIHFTSLRVSVSQLVQIQLVQIQLVQIQLVQIQLVQIGFKLILTLLNVYTILYKMFLARCQSCNLAVTGVWQQIL